ncbi:centromere protein J [Stegostoma tigrinum]|uniref:centromere protein J n=1 Tax=Stegostoma tigrinum TaxID=3053191 RepID=UPI00202B0A7B|nr:centromere protein J [Stegostoma tigrinum]
MRYQMEQLQQLMEQQQKLIKLLSLPMANQGFTLPIGFSSPLTSLSAALSPGINTTAFQFSGPSANENPSNTKGSFCIPLVQIIQSPAQESVSASSVSSDPFQTAMCPPPPRDSGDSMAENSILVQRSSNEKPEIHVSGQQIQAEEAETSVDECIHKDENCPRNLSPIIEDKSELQLEQHAVTPFGIQGNSKKPDVPEERPIRPGIREKQKTFEDLVEELLKVDSELIQQGPQDISEMKVAPKKTFLKRGEGIARFEKSKENMVKEENRSPVCKSTKQFPRKVSFSSQHQFSLPLLNENEKLENKKQLTSKIQIDSSILMEPKAKKSVSINNSLEDTKIKDHTLKEKLDEIKNSTDEGIQSDINVAEPQIKVDSLHKYSDGRKGGCQQDSDKVDITTPEEFQGRITKGSLNLNVPESQYLIGVDPQLKNWPNIFSHGSMERQNQRQQVGQIKMNQLQESSNEQPCFNNISLLEHLSIKRTESTDQATKMGQLQAEKDQNEDVAGATDSRKLLERISPSIGFKKINDRIIQVATDGLLCQSASFGNQQIKDHDIVSFETVGLIPLANNEHSMGFVLKNDGLCCGASNAETNTTSNEDVGPKSQYHRQPMTEILQNSGQTDENLDLSDDADYASDAPSAIEEMNTIVQISQHPIYSRSIAGTSTVKHNALSSTSSSDNEPLECKTIERRFPFPSNRPRRNKNKVMKKKANFVKKCGNSFMNTQTCDSTEPDLMQLSTPGQSAVLHSQLKVSRNSDLPVQVNSRSANVQEDDQSGQLQAKLLQLETEIERFKVENTALAKMKEKQELAMESLRKRMDQFEHEKIEEIARLDEYKKEEMKKLQKAKQLSEEFSATGSIFDKKENEEMEFLKQQLSQLQEDFRKNESRWCHAHKCLRNQIDTLTKENIELRDELKAVDCQHQEPEKKTESSKKSETPVSDAIIKGTSQTVSYRHRSRSSTPTGRRMPMERRLTPADSELKLSGNVTKRPEGRKTEVREIHVKSPVHLRSRSGTPTGWKTHFQDRPIPDPSLNIQQRTPNHQRGQDRKSPTPSVNLSVFQRVNSTGCMGGVQSSNSGSSEDNSCMHLQTAERVTRSQNNTPKRQIQETRTLNQNSAVRSQERPSSGCRSRSATPRGKKTPLDSFELEQKVSRPSSILSRRDSTYFKRKVTYDNVREEIQYPDGKLEQFLTNGSRIITFRNGTRKEVSADGQSVTITFFNGDVKTFMPDQKVIYYYADAKTTHTTYPNGMEMLHFPNNQIEKHYPDGKKEILFPDQTVKHLFPDGHEQSIFPDGTIVNLQKNGDKIVEFNNGQKEIHTSQYKRREYPDGTIKTVYSNGRQETKYSTGRVRIKDKEGNIILDKK